MKLASQWEREVLDAIEASAEELIELGSRLIQTRSENPSGDCADVARLISEHLKQEGIAPLAFDAGEGRVSILSHQGGTSEGERYLVYAGHHDVVPAGDLARWSFPPFSGDVVDGWLRGRGASDMKAGLAGLIHAFVLLHRLDVPLKGRLSLVALPDEETGGQFGAEWLLSQGVLSGATGGIIAEPSERALPTIGQKGGNWFKLTIKGTPGHGSLQPLQGLNANLQGARAIIALQKIWDLKPSRSASLDQLISDSKDFVENCEGFEPGVGDVFEHVTINVGKITGGTSTNVVADTCVIEFDTRVPIGLTREQVNNRIRAILDEEGIQYEFETLGFASEPNWTPPSDPIVESLVEVLQEFVDPNAKGVLQWASSDARTFRKYGIPVLQYGPGELSTIHGFDERVRTEDVLQAAKVYALTAIRYLGILD